MLNKGYFIYIKKNHWVFIYKLGHTWCYVPIGVKAKQLTLMLSFGWLLSKHCNLQTSISMRAHLLL
jgi:hypothetical protein